MVSLRTVLLMGLALATGATTAAAATPLDLQKLIDDTAGQKEAIVKIPAGTFTITTPGIAIVRRTNLTVQGAAEVRSNLSAATGAKKLIEGVDFGKLGDLFTEAPLPGRIGIQKFPGRTERGNHLAGIFEQVSIAFLRFSLRLILLQGCALIDGDGDQAGDGAIGVP